LTPAEREAGRKRQRVRQKKLKPEEFPKPPGFFGVLFDALSLSDPEPVENQVPALKSELEIQSQKDPEKFLNEINQEIDFQQSTFLHLATRNNHLDAVW